MFTSKFIKDSRNLNFVRRNSYTDWFTENAWNAALGKCTPLAGEGPCGTGNCPTKINCQMYIP